MEVYDSDGELCFDAQDKPIYGHFYPCFVSYDYRAQIIGCHGTGKTTFLIGFIKFLERQDHIVNHFTLNDRQRFLTRGFWEYHNYLMSQSKYGELKKPPIAVIDGYEQLSLDQKMWLRMACRKGRCGLLISTHSPAWRIPVLLHTKPTYKTLQHVIKHLFSEIPDIEPPDESLCRSLFEQHHGNIRNVLFDLYDHYEQGAGMRGQG